MKFTLSIVERVNVGNYEFVELTGSVEFTDQETGPLTPDQFGTQELDGLLRSHRRRTQGLVPEDINSFALDHPALED